jgi:hypothetical protein
MWGWIAYKWDWEIKELIKFSGAKAFSVLYEIMLAKAM